MKHGDAFSGVGGFGLAARDAGWSTEWACEIEPSARSIYAHHLGHDGLRFDSDIRESRDLPTIDILTGGFPCQDLSVAGKRAGLAGGRSGLFFELVRILQESRPEWFVFENVPGLLSSHGGRDMAVVLSSLVECGYGVAYRILNAQFFGVAQRRRRVFIVGHSSGDERRAAAVLFERASMRRDTSPIGEAGRGVAHCLTQRTHKGDPTSDQYVTNAITRRDDVHNGQDDDGSKLVVVAPLTQRPYGDGATDDPPLVAGTISANGRRVDADKAGSNQLVAHSLRAEGFDASEDGTGRGTPLITATLRCGGMADASHPAGSSYDNTPVVYQCHGSNVGPLGTIRAGNGNETGGVPFLAVPEGEQMNDNGGHYGNASQAHSFEILHSLREDIGAQAFEAWGIGIVTTLQQTHLLRPGLYVNGIRVEAEEGNRILVNRPLSREEGCPSGVMREMWKVGREGRSPQGSRSPEQLSGELGAHLSRLPYSRASATWILRGLWEASEGLGLLQQTLSEIQEIWRPARNEGKPIHHSSSVRRLVPAECEALQGFPRHWTCVQRLKIAPTGSLDVCRICAEGPDSPRYKGLGNAVAVPVVRWIFERINEVNQENFK